MSQPTFELSVVSSRDGRIGIIDIGSNSIRLVVYDQQKRCPVPIYNEKVMCALGKGLATSGILNPDGIEMAEDALKRFLAMSKNMEVTSLYIMATAAIRDAQDGKSFARLLSDRYHIDIDIISGQKEAKLGAFGVCASIHKPNGITGDLGGGSIELVRVDEGHIEDHTSLLLGSLRMIDETKGDKDKLRKLIDKRFEEINWLDDHKTSHFYAIGGSFRALAKMHMEHVNYPLKILHEYTVRADEFAKFLASIMELPADKLEKLPGVATKRIPALPGAAMVLEKIIRTAKPKLVVFSASGIREGYLYEKLSPFSREQDGLLTSCHEYATKGGRSTAYANELYTWMQPLVDNETESQGRIRFALCLLTDIALHIHPEYRADWAFHRMLYSALTGISHKERVTLALALYYRYQYKAKADWPALKLIDASDMRWAKLVGSCANLAYHLSGSVAGSLHKTSLEPTGKNIALHLTDGMEDAMGDAIRRRIEVINEGFKSYVAKSA
ncbi:MAG: Ppx/GppA family phosphatase [Rickettsiales bacterium]|nr:Ppx/GppA family phosphatase [Rickettsiales bacterium]